MNPAASQCPPVSAPRRGFALVLTLSLMILLVLLAVGLLTLSSVSLRMSSQTAAMETARSNARLALMLAIGQLQKASGPDQRITMCADQRSSGDGSKTSAAKGNAHWTGVYQSWPATSATRPDPKFVSWLISGDVKKVVDANFADTGVSPRGAVRLVDTGTLGPDSREGVSVPAVTVSNESGTTGRIAWWTGDQGVKAVVASPVTTPPSDPGPVRQGLQAAARNAVDWAKADGAKPFAKLAAGDVRTKRAPDWGSTALLASPPAGIRPLFHDLAASSTGMLTNVTAGGFRRDLSLQLQQRSLSAVPRTPLYTVSGSNGINLQELAAYYTLPAKLVRSGSHTFTTGGRLESRAPFLEVAGNPKACSEDDAFHFKQPVVISYQLVLSFKAFPVAANGVTRQRLHVVCDPVITLWNPLDLPVVVPTGSFITVKYWMEPYDLVVTSSSGTKLTAPLAASLAGSTATNNRDFNFLSIELGKSEELVFKPGEVIKFSQTGASVVMAGGGSGKNSLGANKGFNYGGGFAMPVRDLAGATIDLNPNDRITYEAKANNLTAGKTSQSGNSVTGDNLHTRHFSLTHHELYVGADRRQLNASLGYGGIFIDWDFGNVRLKPGEIRTETQPGTKPANERLYANRLPDVFKPIKPTDTRPLSYSQLVATKSPFMMFSFDAKTETGSDSGTRTLARFNPRAHHVDFYTLSESERAMLPYEFKVQPLVSWTNRSLEQSPDGSGFFGGGLNAQDGTSMVCAHSVPREPVVSLAALQNSFANGFEIFRPVDGYAILNNREPLLPQISHAIGNSMAPSMLDPAKTEGALPGRRPVADHSFLANRALWDDWFFSGIAAQTAPDFAKSKDQKTVATEFFFRKIQAAHHPLHRRPRQRRSRQAGSLIFLRSLRQRHRHPPDRLLPARGRHVQRQFHLGRSMEGGARRPARPADRGTERQWQG